MAMSKKHYIEVATILASERDKLQQGANPAQTLDRITHELGTFFAEDNGNFNRSTFNAAAAKVSR